MSRRLLIACAAAVLLTGVTAAPAAAHAMLEATAPERGASLHAAPGQVALRFNEPVETTFGAVRVYDAHGHEVQQGTAFHPSGDARRVAVRLRSGLPRGGYTATYRVISADSHPVSGGFLFGVGAAASGRSVADLLAGQSSGPVTSVAFGAVRALQYAAIALGLGVLAVLWLAWLPALRALATSAESWRAASDAFARRARTLLLSAAAAGLSAALLAFPLQAATAEGTSFWSALGDARDVLHTRFGTVWALGGLAWISVLGVVATRRATVPALRPATVGATGVAVAGPGRWLAPVALPLLALAFLPGLGGHAGVEDPTWVLLPANVLHVLAAGAWIGGLAVLVLALPAATRRVEGADRTQLLAGVITRFSTLALAAVAGLLVGGIVQSLLELGAVDDLVDTAFGRAVSIKIALVLGLLACGALNRRRTVPALRRAAAEAAPSGRAGLVLRRTLRIEVALGVTALAVTGALAGYPPATAQSSGPYSGSANIGPARAELTVDPARPGPNELHLYLFDRRDGSQWDQTKELMVEAALPSRRIAAIHLHPHKAGSGHYIVDGAALSPPGAWTVQIVARVSAFDEYRTDFKVPIK